MKISGTFSICLKITTVYAKNLLFQHMFLPLLFFFNHSSFLFFLFQTKVLMCSIVTCLTKVSIFELSIKTVCFRCSSNDKNVGRYTRFPFGSLFFWCQHVIQIENEYQNALNYNLIDRNGIHTQSCISNISMNTDIKH